MKKSELSKLIVRAGGNVLTSLPKTQKNLYCVKILGTEESFLDYSKKKQPTKKLNFTTNYLSHRWILDSISSHKLLEPAVYVIKQ